MAIGLDRRIAPNQQHPNAMLAGAGGSALGGPLTSLHRAAPAEDVVDALSRLNQAILAAAKAGWQVKLTTQEQAPAFTGEGPTYQIIAATIAKEV